ncbi:hypothetical protein LINPERHAP2_LOCUS3273, partial [Linum perenne]
MKACYTTINQTLAQIQDLLERLERREEAYGASTVPRLSTMPSTRIAPAQP